MRRAIACAALLLVGACSTPADDTGSEPTEVPSVSDEVEAVDTDEVKVTLGEWSVLPDPLAVEAGEIEFNVKNEGKDPHEFVIVKTDLEPGKLPLAKDESVDEDEVDLIDEVEELEPADTGDIKVDLEPGDYVLLCNLVEVEDGENEVHYQLGMRTAFRVE